MIDLAKRTIAYVSETYDKLCAEMHIIGIGWADIEGLLNGGARSMEEREDGLWRISGRTAQGVRFWVECHLREDINCYHVVRIGKRRD